MSQQINKRIVLKIHQVVGEGVKQVREMQRHIHIFVKMELFQNQELPPTTCRRYFPKMSDFRNQKYRASIKLKFSKLDLENLEEKVKEWRQQRPRDMFFFRGYGEVVDEDNMKCKWNGKCDDDTRVDHSDVTATSSKLLYKAVFPPNKGIKKKLWSARFFRFVYLFHHRHVIRHLSQ